MKFNYEVHHMDEEYNLHLLEKGTFDSQGSKDGVKELQRITSIKHDLNINDFSIKSWRD